ncbi:50S ribosomal protein L17 [Blattabacterium cuenoti]|nr:50S ribosomal protein L17 [Blattabacterium cuenoti]
MNHGKKNNPLNRKYGHKKSFLSNIASSLIKEKRIFTTLSKAKELRKYIEPIITKSKIDSIHSRRIILSYLRDKKAVFELFKDSFKKVRERQGGYTRILKVGYRYGDKSSISFIELVDFNKNSFFSKKKKYIRRSKKKKNIDKL